MIKKCIADNIFSKRTKSTSAPEKLPNAGKQALSMRKMVLLAVAALATLPLHGNQRPELFQNENWTKMIRPGHPRLFINPDILPAVRQRAQGERTETFRKLRRFVNALPDDAPMIFTPDPVPRRPDGSLDVAPGTQGVKLFKYSGGDQAAISALIYLITKEPQYAEKAKKYLFLAVKAMRWTAENDIFHDTTGSSRINALAAYDWIYDTLTPQERRDILVPILDYITEAQPEGKYRFRRTIGDADNGNYGERALMYFAGVVGYGDGIDDARCADFLQRGILLFADMLDHREKTSAGSGVLSTLTPAYSFGHYPFATFLFFYSTISAFNCDISSYYPQMSDYYNWFDFAMIRRKEPGEFFHFGIGDCEHLNNESRAGLIYNHIAQAIHFYGRQYPEKAYAAYALLGEIEEQRRLFSTTFHFIGFLINHFDPTMIAKAAANPPQSPDYFHAPGFGLIIMRSGRGADDTYLSFRAGSLLNNHQHYDELSFVIVKNGFLALDAGSRTETDHHHNFAPQSVAHNTILIHQDREKMPPFWKAWSYRPDGKEYYNHGGQNSGTSARLVKLESKGAYVYAAGDATRSYADTKSREVVRQLVYIKPDYVVVYDRVESVNPEQRKEFLLHFQNRPETLGGQSFRAENGGTLFVHTVLPEKADINWIGGPGREFWASGRNWELDGGQDWDKKYQVTGKWRMEVSNPTEPAAAVRFLHFLQAAAPGTLQGAPFRYLKTESEDGISFTAVDGKQWEVFFRRSGPIDYRIGIKEPTASAKPVSGKL